MCRRRRWCSGEQRLGQAVIDKVAGQLAASFPVNRIASQVLDALARAPGWTDLKARLLFGAHAGRGVLERNRPAAVPTLEEVRRYARARLAQTPSLEDIAVLAREKLLALVYSRLSEATASAA